MRILQWLAGHDKGLSSEAIALTALGEMPPRPNYPHDGDDFGRCYRLLAACPDAKAGWEKLGRDGGAIWQALFARWTEIEAAYLHDKQIWESDGPRKAKIKNLLCFDLMQSIIRPIEDAEQNVIRGNGWSARVE